MGDKPALHPQTALGDALRAVARDVLAEARAAIENPGNSDAAAVHDFRKAMKRWRALLRLLEPLLPQQDRELRIAARDLARALAGARDAQAALDGLKDIAETESGLSARSLATLQARLEQRKHIHEAATLTSGMRGQIHDLVADAERAVAAWEFPDLAFSELARQLAAGYRRARSRIPADWREAEPEALHALRQAVVAHRYQMELVVPLWPRLGKMWVAEAQRLRDHLGACQDLGVLAGLTAPHAALAHWRSRLTPAIAARHGAHVSGARRLAERLFAERPKAFQRRLEAMWSASASRRGKPLRPAPSS